MSRSGAGLGFPVTCMDTGIKRSRGSTRKPQSQAHLQPLAACSLWCQEEVPGRGDRWLAELLGWAGWDQHQLGQVRALVSGPAGLSPSPFGPSRLPTASSLPLPVCRARTGSPSSVPFSASLGPSGHSSGLHFAPPTSGFFHPLLSP